MENIKNDILLRTARGEKTERSPVWVMRQAGRILPEYRAVREKAKNFVEFVKSPEMAAEVTIQPVDILGVDAAIIFSDILVIPEAMGLPYEMQEKRGPWFPQTIRIEDDLKKLHVSSMADYGYVIEAIKLTKKELNDRVPLIGFAGAPWTIFAYMTEGSGSKTFSVARSLLYNSPTFAHKLLQLITDSTIAYLKDQIVAGANIVQLFDSWAGILSPAHYRLFALPYIRQICEAVTEVPVVVFPKGAFFSLKDFDGFPCEVVGLDWNMDPEWSRQQVGKEKVLQGNMDPALLYSSFDNIRLETRKMLHAFGPHHIANLGHGVYPDIEADKVKCFIDTVKEFGI
ncbi:MAG TPA: uroporphyrinogen decarboxylase [Cytophagales bacterium]|nr:uroporphyrinogen decarboxylase [Cytophagales bacterium]